jgi:hypothetical protein
MGYLPNSKLVMVDCAVMGVNMENKGAYAYSPVGKSFAWGMLL